MTFLGRVFASAIARRLAVVIVSLLLGAVGISNARAACSSSKDVANDSCPSESAARLAATAAYNEWAATITGGQEHSMCSIDRWPDANSREIRVQASFNGWGCGAGGTWYRSFPEVANDCPTKPDQFGWLVDNLGAKCFEGCTYAYNPSASAFSATGSTCTPSPDEPEPQLDTDGDGVPDDKDAFPNDPNESKDTDGDGIGDNADVAPEDPDNGKDDGEGDEKDNQAGGGGDCGAPPSCKGDAIACNTNWQIWRMRCQGTATGSVTGDVTNCNAGINVTSPDPLANANIILQRKIACKTGDSTGNQGDGQQPEWTKVNGMSQDPGKGGTDSDIPGINEVKVTADTLDQSGFGGGACVGFVAAGSGTGVSSGFTQTLATPPAFFCDYIGWLKLAIITGAAIYSVIVISKGHA
ncbi:hypothetical protein [Xanthomonas sp. MWU16-30325]|uniref:hypothetical protein n=1 Tax=Xanthomonas sp. MWU16-30325 TaxID=2878096 RepID=UPI001CF8A63B|nr:hypothetical protein [Xanthomonas sp. MWU16-30325]